MNRMELHLLPRPVTDELAIELWMNGEALGHINLDASSLENHIHNLARARAAMKEQVAPELEPSARLEAVIDPVWKIPDPAQQQGHVLCLRHPGFGWLAFDFPADEAKNIAQWLMKDT